MPKALDVTFTRGQPLDLGPLFDSVDAVDTYFAYYPGVQLRIRNSSPDAIAVTLKTQRPCDQGFVKNEPVAILSNTERTFEEISRSRFESKDHLVHMSFTSSVGISAVVYV